MRLWVELVESQVLGHNKLAEGRSPFCWLLIWLNKAQSREIVVERSPPIV
ncbi:hypothetical protein ACQ4M4_21590 [Leptolyngbya sp. AN02str]